MTRTIIGMLFASLLISVASLAADTPKEAVGFWGTVTGTVKSAKEDGTGFVLTVSDAVPGEHSKVTDASGMKGKDLTLGTRMPVVDGKGTPKPEDVAYIKTLKVGDVITVPIFATMSNPTVLRIKAPGQPATTEPAKADGEKKEGEKSEKRN